MLAIKEGLMFLVIHMMGDAKAMRYEIIVAKIFFKDSIAKKTT